MIHFCFLYEDEEAVKEFEKLRCKYECAKKEMKTNNKWRTS